MEKSLRLPISSPRYQIATEQVRHLTARGSWCELATSHVRNTILEKKPRCTLPPPTTAPWQCGVLDGKVRLDLLGSSRRTHSEWSRLVDTISTISSYGPLDLTIFKDGSVEEGTGESGSVRSSASRSLLAMDSRPVRRCGLSWHCWTSPKRMIRFREWTS